MIRLTFKQGESVFHTWTKSWFHSKGAKYWQAMERSWYRTNAFSSILDQQDMN